jgi:hypothetical protein
MHGSDSNETAPPTIEAAVLAMFHATSRKIIDPLAMVSGKVGSPIVQPPRAEFQVAVTVMPTPTSR